MKCNSCWRELEQETVFITSCSHIFCGADAKRIFSNEKICPLCDNPLTSKSCISGVDLVVDESKVLQLCGLVPKDILSISAKAVSFWEFQKQIEMEYQKAEVKKRTNDMQILEKAFNERMLEASNQINSLKHKIVTMSDEIELGKKEINELKEKYAETTRQKRKLTELYESLKQQKENKTTSEINTVLNNNVNNNNNNNNNSYNTPRKEFLFGNGNRTISTPKGEQTTNYKDRFALARQNSPLSPPTVINRSPKPTNLTVRNNTNNSNNGTIGNTNTTTSSSFSPFVPKRPTTPLFAKRTSSALLSSI